MATGAGEPRWLDDDEQKVWRTFLEANRLLNDRLDRQMQTDSGITHSYYEVLVRLSEAPDRTLRMSELAGSLLSSRSRLTHAVNKLEERGWVVRTPCEVDKRGQWAHLTDEGFAALEEAAPGHVEAVRRHLLDPLSPTQVRQLGEIMAAVRDGLLDDPTD